MARPTRTARPASRSARSGSAGSSASPGGSWPADAQVRIIAQPYGSERASLRAGARAAPAPSRPAGAAPAPWGRASRRAHPGGGGRLRRTRGGRARAQRLQPLAHRGPGTVAARGRIEHDAAAERVRRRDRADHDAVAGARQERMLQPRLPQVAAQPHEPPGGVAGAVVHVHARRRLAGELERGVEPVRRLRAGARIGDHVAAAHGPPRAARRPG